jgi:hypothetical protein
MVMNYPGLFEAEEVPKNETFIAEAEKSQTNWDEVGHPTCVQTVHNKSRGKSIP